MKKAPYFKTPDLCSDGSPAPSPLSCSVNRVARFEEVDPLNIVWHGRYPSYFEDARVAFGEKYGMGYSDFYSEKLAVPIKQMYIEYISPLSFAQECVVTATMHWTEAARINFSYIIHGKEEKLFTTGYTVQLFIQPDKELCMAQPAIYAEFCKKWRAGELV